MKINFNKLNLVNSNFCLDFFIGATFFAAVFQDLLMVLMGMYARLLFGFHQNYLTNPFMELYLFKIAKYLFFLCAFYFSIIDFSWKVLAKILVVVIFILAPSLVIDFIEGNYLLVVLGIKATLPIFAYFIGMRMNDLSYGRLIILIKITLWINFGIALFQQFLYFSHLSQSNQDFSKNIRFFTEIRSGGSFLEPNTLGLYGLICLLVLLIGFRLNVIIKSVTLYSSLAYLIIIMSWSRAAMLAATLTIIVFSIFPKHKEANKNINYLLAVSVVLVTILMFYGRGFESVLIRLRDFHVLLFQGDFFTMLFGRGFGYGTLSSQTYSHLFHDFSISISNTDSQWIAFYIQGGYWLLFAVVAIFSYTFLKKGFEIKVLLINMCLVGFGIQFIEAWPFGFIAFMMMGYCIRQDKKACLS